MTAQTNQDKESGAPPLVNSSPKSGVATDPEPQDDNKKEPVSHKGSLRKADDQEKPHSRHLWVGNVSPTVTEATLAEQFSRFGDVESVTMYSSRNYAFVNFRNEEDAVYAKKGLHGMVLEGHGLRIEFAKGAKPCRHLWVGGICSSVTKDQLEAEFKKFGVIEDLRLLRERNCAFVDFKKNNDAIAAYESLNKKKIGKKELRVEYGRSQPTLKRDGRNESQLQEDKRTTPTLDLSEVLGPADPQAEISSGGKPALTDEKNKDNKEGDASEVLWIGFPIHMKVDERSLHRAFSPFGVIERITTFPGRTYAFVQFQSVKAACRAKDALQGKLFNDPRVNISFAKSEVGPVDHNRGTTKILSSPLKGGLPLLSAISKAEGLVNPRNDRFLANNSMRPSSPTLSTKSGKIFTAVELQEERSYSQGHEYAAESNFKMGGDFTRGLRPGLERRIAAEMELRGNIPLPERFTLQPHRLVSEDRWDSRENEFLRELKRQKVGGGHSVGGLTEFPYLELSSEKQLPETMNKSDHLSSRLGERGGIDGRIMGTRLPLKPPTDGHRQEQEELKHGFQSITSLAGPGIELLREHKEEPLIAGSYFGAAKDGWKWHGTIAKSGTMVCQAQCFAVTRGIEVTFPDVVNCTARTNLDMLAKHISQVGDFGVVSFVPQGKLDVGPYQDFMVYLTDKKRAAVCRLSDEATLFLVPPSEFAEQFLKVNDNSCIFGVLLKLHQLQSQPSKESVEQLPGLQQFIQIQKYPPLISSNFEENYQRPTLQVFAELPSSDSVSISGQTTKAHKANIPVTREMVAIRPPSLQLQPHYQPAVFAGNAPVQAAVVSSGSTMGGNMVWKGLTAPITSVSHPLVGEFGRSTHQTQGWPLMLQEQQNSTMIGGFSLPSSVELQSSQQEQGITLHPHGTLPSFPLPCVPAIQYSIPPSGEGQNLFGADSHVLSSNIQYQQLLRPPPFPPLSAQIPQPDQMPQPTNFLTHQQHMLSDGVQILQQGVQQQLPPLNDQQHTNAQPFLSSTAQLFSESLAIHGLHQQHHHTMPSTLPPQGGNWENLAEVEQTEVSQAGQQPLSVENRVKAESDEDRKRFQATLELAAALLQQLQQRTET